MDVAVIGAGPAGLMTALQLKRYGIPCVLFEGGTVGGLLHNANLVENYPGFPGGIRGTQLVSLFAEQAINAGVEITPQTVIRIAHDGQAFLIHTGVDSYHARAAVFATGTKPVTLPGHLLADEIRERVYYEVHPLQGLNGCRVAVIGAGDAAFDYALNLARHNEVLILNRGRQIKCLPLLWQRASASKRIAYYPETCLVKAASQLENRLHLDCEQTDRQLTLVVDYLVAALGRVPRLDLLSGLTDIESLQQNNLLHLVGDARRGVFRQTTIAVGDGMLAAMKIYQQLKEEG